MKGSRISLSASIIVFAALGCGGSGGKLPKFVTLNLNRPANNYNIAGATANGDFYGYESNTTSAAVIYRANGTVDPITTPGGTDLKLVDLSSNGKWIGSDESDGQKYSGIGNSGTLFTLTTSPRTISYQVGAINNAGDVAGIWSSSSRPVVFKKTGSGTESFYTNIDGFNPTQVIGITGSGVIAGNAAAIPARGESRVFVTSGTSLLIYEEGYVTDVTEGGRILGNDSSGPWVMNSPTSGRTRLPLPNGATGIASRMNERGDVVGNFTLNNVVKPCLWDSGTGAFIDLSSYFPEGGFYYPNANAIAPEGDILGTLLTKGTGIVIRLRRN